MSEGADRKKRGAAGNRERRERDLCQLQAKGAQRSMGEGRG